MTLTEFLLARIAEDEAMARSLDAELAKDFGSTEAQLCSPLSLVGTGYMDYPAISIDSTRVLAECEAKRRIVEEHGPADPCDAHDGATMETIPCDTLRYLAAVYAEHADYREEWRP